MGLQVLYIIYKIKKTALWYYLLTPFSFLKSA